MPPRRHYDTETKAEAVALAVTSGSEADAARQLGLPQQRVNEWVRSTSSADLRLFVQAKQIEAAAGVVDRLPAILEKLVKRTEEVLEDDTVRWNGTQLQAAHVGIAVLIDKINTLTGSGATGGRFGTHSSGSGAGLTLDGDDLVERAITRAQGGAK